MIPYAVWTRLWAMAALLEVEDLEIEFPSDNGPVGIVNGVSLRIHPGEAVALVGESGCGKSLTALSLFRLVPPPGRIAGGIVRFQGRDVMALSENELCTMRGKGAAMVFQDPLSALNPVMKVGDQIREAVLAHETISRAEAMARAVDAMRLVGLPDPGRRYGDYPHQLSGGRRQRVLLAMALACRPALLVADEPTTAIDVTVQAQILDLLDGLRRQLDMAVLLITHDLGVVARFAQRVYVMYCGRVVEEASVADLFTRPGHPYTRGLLASVPRMDRRPARLPAIPGTVPPPGGLPPGCAFEPRCSAAVDACRAAVPQLRPCGEGRSVRCVLDGEDRP